MTDIYIFRHGDTIESNRFLAKFFRRGGGARDLDILPKGIPALRRIGEFLKNIKTDADFSSPYLRCRKSSEMVGDIANKYYKTDERIRELEKNSEYFSDFYNRINSFLDDIQRKNYKTVSICTHGAVIAGIKHLSIKGKFYFFQIWDFPAPGNLIIIKNGKTETIDFNQSI